jgi:hypothetical protein
VNSMHSALLGVTKWDLLRLQGLSLLAGARSRRGACGRPLV